MNAISMFAADSEGQYAIQLLTLFAFLGIILALWGFAGFWAYRDAQERDRSGGLVAALVVLFFPLGWLLWLALRPPLVSITPTVVRRSSGLLNEPILLPDVVRLARAIRFALVAFVLGGSYFPIRASFCISAMQRVFSDMLGGKPLPTLTSFVITVRPVLIVCSVLIPLLALSTLFSRRFVASFYLIGVLGLALVAEIVLLWQALSGPLASIISQMQGPQ